MKTNVQITVHKRLSYNLSNSIKHLVIIIINHIRKYRPYFVTKKKREMKTSID